jgi:hypothetical protein
MRLAPARRDHDALPDGEVPRGGKIATGESESFEDAERLRRQAVTARLVPGEPGPIDADDRQPVPRGRQCGRGSGRARAGHDEVHRGHPGDRTAGASRRIPGVGAPDGGYVSTAERTACQNRGFPRRASSWRRAPVTDTTTGVP